MARRAKGAAPTLITSARKSRTLDTDERTKRYLLTMLARVVCFVVGCILPAPWNWLMFVAAGVLPGVAVVLGNAIDQRTTPDPEVEGDAGPRRALPSGVIVPGSVDDTQAIR